jgi:hypothetical protein
VASRINLSQIQSKLRQIESQRRQAIDKYNQQVRQHNQRVQQGIRDLNSAVARYNNEVYNNEVRTHNNRVRANQQRLRSEVARLQSRPATRYVQFRESVVRVSTSFERLEHRSSSKSFSPQENFFVDLSEQEAANTVGVFNALAADDGESDVTEGSDLQETRIVDEIAAISEELDSRWRGALFALNPKNPEAARHFCTSVREVFTQVLDLKAPDSAVFAALPSSARTDRGNATRRSKMTYLLSLKGIENAELAEFASDDIKRRPIV